MRLKKTACCTATLLGSIMLICGSTLINSCGRKATGYQLTGDTVRDGEHIARQYCTGCHRLVPAEALTKDVWKFHVLPDMSHFVGLSTYSAVNYYKKTPDSVGVPLADWEVLVAYYQKVAPAELKKAIPPSSPLKDWAGFRLRKPDSTANVDYTTMLAVDSQTNKIYTSDEVTEEFDEWGPDLKRRTVAQLPSAAFDAKFLTDKGSRKAVVSCIGQIMPYDFPNGRLMEVNLDGRTGKQSPVLIQSELARPVQAVSADFNRDGLNDLVVLSQGGYHGGVYLLKQTPSHSYVQSTISNKPGAAQAITGDFNGDGWPDLMVLYGNADEGLWMYLNDHKGGFAQKNLLRFPPVYGSSSFVLTDINHDGKPDLIYTCGYNYRNSRILKPYHGLYLFMNEGDWKFKQTWFYPINGCTKAVAADFDGDGDVDIATSAFFADMKDNPAEEFLYFEQDRPMHFTPHAIPVSGSGRWMTMTVADLNRDGKPDILLGNYGEGFMFQPGYRPFWSTHTPFVILENHTKK